MPTCIVVLSNIEKANELNEKLQAAATPLVKCELIKPRGGKQVPKDEKAENIDWEMNAIEKGLNPKDIDMVKLLNPQLSRQARQKSMAFWLMPFGFIAGITFTQMTALSTVSDLGVGSFGELLPGGLVGMISGWMGSYVASASVNSKNSEDIKSLRKLNEEGLWLILLETPFEVELPWYLINKLQPIQVVRLLDQ